MYDSSSLALSNDNPAQTFAPLPIENPYGGRTLRLSAGRHLFRHGDPAKQLYEILEGVVRTSIVLMDGRRQVLSFGFPGDIVGLNSDANHHSDCEALTDITVRSLNVSSGQPATASDLHNGELQHFLFRCAASEVARMREHFVMLGRKTALERVASFLVVLLDRAGERIGSENRLSLPMSRADIADFLGITVETVSRMLTRLRKSGIIQLQGLRGVCVRQPMLLRELAEIVD